MSSIQYRNEFTYIAAQTHQRQIIKIKRTIKKLYINLAKLNNKIYYLNRCISEGLIPDYISRTTNNGSINTTNYTSAHRQNFKRHTFIYHNKILRMDRKNTYFNINHMNYKINNMWQEINQHIDNYEFNQFNTQMKNTYFNELEKSRYRSNQKLKKLRNNILQQYIHPQNKYVENLTTVQIPQEVIRALALGPKFGFTKNNNNKNMLTLIKNVESNLKHISNKNEQIRCRNKINTTITNYLNRNSSQNIYKKIENIIAADIKKTIKFKKENQDRLIFLRSDKGNTTVIMHKEDYVQKTKDIIQDPQKYEKCTNKNPLGKIERSINKYLQNLYDQDIISKEQHQQLKCKHAQPGHMYFVAKTHKENCPLRCIITSYDTPNLQLNKYLAQLLKTIAYNEHRIKNSKEALEKIKNLKIEQDEILCSCDVVSLYPNVPLDIIKTIISTKWRELQQYTKMNLQQFQQLFDLCMSTNIFEHDGEYYIQKSGVPIGGTSSSIIADLLINHIHEEVFKKFNPKLIIYYVDDSLCIIKRNKTTSLLQELNTLHPNIKYTIETENHNSISFLDIQIHRKDDGNLFTNLYKKPQKSSRTINYFSHHPNHQKANLITNEARRAIMLSDEQFHVENLDNIMKNFLENGYPMDMIQENITLGKNKKANNAITTTIEKPKIKGSIPYVPILSENIRQHLRRSGIDIVFSVEKPLANITNNKGITDTLKRKNVVYAIPCASCKKNNKDTLYIGETKRPLQERLKEHFNSCAKQEPKTALAQHAIEERHEFNLEAVKILHTEEDMFRRRFCESFFIGIYDGHTINLKTETERSSLVYANLISKIKKDFYKIDQFQ